MPSELCARASPVTANASMAAARIATASEATRIFPGVALRIGLSLRAGQLKLGCEYLAHVIAGRIVEKCLRKGLLVLRNRRVGVRANDLAAAGRGQSINRHVVVLDEFEGGVECGIVDGQIDDAREADWLIGL